MEKITSLIAVKTLDHLHGRIRPDLLDYNQTPYGEMGGGIYQLSIE